MARRLPEGWPRLSVSLFYDDAPRALAWLHDAFGFEERLRVPTPNGRIVHSELTLGDAVIMVASADEGRRSPRALGGAITGGPYVFVDDVDAHCARARAAGAVIVQEPADREFGQRTYQARDLEGQHWAFGQAIGP
jgi:uncharacterized glyoxalase superfamily protein PhnB